VDRMMKYPLPKEKNFEKKAGEKGAYFFSPK
jgi:hypothetical protein